MYLQIAFLFVTQNCKLSIRFKPGKTPCSLRWSHSEFWLLWLETAVWLKRHVWSGLHNTLPLFFLSSRISLSLQLEALLSGKDKDHKDGYIQTSAARLSSQVGWLLRFIYLSVNSLEIITSDIFLSLSLQCGILPRASSLPLAARAQPPAALAGTSHLPGRWRWGSTGLPAPLCPGREHQGPALTRGSEGAPAWPPLRAKQYK